MQKYLIRAAIAWALSVLFIVFAISHFKEHAERQMWINIFLALVMFLVGCFNAKSPKRPN
jgi:ABC-type Co2+ transport system permease subunit